MFHMDIHKVNKVIRLNNKLMHIINIHLILYNEYMKYRIVHKILNYHLLD